jgi:hypothetical protein
MPVLGYIAHSSNRIQGISRIASGVRHMLV